MRARVRGCGRWCWWKTASILENELARSCSRVVEGGGGGKQLLSSKTSMHARVRGWWKVVLVENSFYPRKRACALVFEGGGSGGGGKQLPPSKTSMSARVRGWWELVELANNHHPRNRA